MQNKPYDQQILEKHFTKSKPIHDFKKKQQKTQKTRNKRELPQSVKSIYHKHVTNIILNDERLTE